MPVVLALWSMVLRHLLRSPALWTLFPALLVAIPLLQELRPLATPVVALELLRDWSFPAGLVGTTMALQHLMARQSMLERVPDAERLAGEWGACLLGPAFLQLPMVLGACSGRPEGLDLARALTDILSSDLHLAGLALVSLTLPMPSNGRLFAFLVLAWALPALLAQGPSTARLAALLDASRPLAAPGAALTTALAGLGLALVHALRRTSPNASR